MSDALTIELETLLLINRARAACAEDLGVELPPVERAPHDDREMHEALDCLGVRRPTWEMVFDRGVWRIALACARAWSAGYTAHDYASLEFDEGMVTLVKCVSVVMPAPMAEYARMSGIGSDDI